MHWTLAWILKKLSLTRLQCRRCGRTFYGKAIVVRSDRRRLDPESHAA